MDKSDPKIFVLGPKGTNTERAAQENWGSKVTDRLEYVGSIASVFENVSKKRAIGVIPVEDSVEGDVPHVLDFLRRYDKLHVVKEIQLPVTHVLLAKNEDMRKIKIIASHPQALAHCQNYLRRNFPKAKLIEMRSTADAARAASSNPKIGAIASEWVAGTYDLKIVDKGIHDYGSNYTRFFVISSKLAKIRNPQQTSIVVDASKDQPGVLYQILGEFAKRMINLTRIQSRPNRGILGEYSFFIDFADGRQAQREEIFRAIEKKKTIVRWLGSYRIKKVPREKIIKEEESQLSKDDLRLMESSSFWGQ